MAIFVAGGFVLHPRVKFVTNLAASVALGVVAALLITAARVFG